MDFGRAFTYAFQDTDWIKKVGLAAVIFIIPIIGPITVLGWGLEITRRVIHGEMDLLPDWSNFGGTLSKGFQAFVVILAYSLPSILISICQQAVSYGNLAASNSDSSTQIGMVASFAVICLSCLSFVFSIALGLVMPAAIASLADTGQMGSAFRFNQVVALFRAAPGPYIIQFLIVSLASLILIPIGLVICIIGVFAAAAYLTTISSHLYGQSYKIARNALMSSGAAM